MADAFGVGGQGTSNNPVMMDEVSARSSPC